MQHLKNTKKPGEFEKFIDNDDKTGLCLEDTLIRNLNVINNGVGIANKIEFYSPENELSGYILYESNENNRITNNNGFNANDSLIYYTTWTYNEKGLNNSTKSFDGKGDVTWDGKFEYLTYDKHGNWTSMKASNDGELKFLFEREYEYY